VVNRRIGSHRGSSRSWIRIKMDNRLERPCRRFSLGMPVNGCPHDFDRLLKPPKEKLLLFLFSFSIKGPFSGRWISFNLL
jgi:hypothetical protein